MAENKDKVIPKISVASSSAIELHDVIPHEIAGGQTGKRFEFQYERSAIACLELLESTDNLCVFCEWHDDYVLERKNEDLSANAKVLYAFHQVKTQATHLGPWKLTTVFQINAKSIAKPEKIAKSHFYKLMRHFSDFGETVEKIIFHTNAGIDKNFRLFLEDIEGSNVITDLIKENKAMFDNIYKQYEPLFNDLTEEKLFQILKKFNVIYDDAVLNKSNEQYKTTLMDKIQEYSEIDLRNSEAGKICDELLGVVRKKSQNELKFKSNKDHVRNIKGIEVQELLSLLSLSYSGYKSLTSGEDKQAVKKLSRLQRLLRESDSDLDEIIIESLCGYKTDWDGYRRQFRHIEALEVEYLVLKQRAFDILKKWTTEKDFNFEKVVNEAEVLAKNYSSKFTSVGELTKTLVVGLILSCSIDGD